MARKTEFRTVEFFRKVRDEHAARLAGKSNAEIIEFFRSSRKAASGPSARPGGRSKSAARRPS